MRIFLLMILITLGAAACSKVCPIIPASIHMPGCPSPAPTPMPTADLNLLQHEGH